jgi:hypothetical protein
MRGESMRRRFSSVSLLFLASVVLSAIPTSAAGPEITTTSRPVRLMRGWEETVKNPDGTETPRRVEVLFDYEHGIGFENFYSMDGRLIGRARLGAGAPAPSPVEIQEAFDRVREDPEFARIFKRFKVVFEGGFILLEEKGRPCGPGSRCLRVFLLSSDRAGTIRQVVVDLVKDRVVYDDFAPRTRTP